MEVYSPETLDEALLILNERKEGIYILSGGTDLVIQIKERVVRPRALLDLSRIKSLRFVREDGDFLRIGGGTRIRELFSSDLIKDHATPLWEAARAFGSPQIKNLATIGGNIANASPVGDTLPPLFVLDASIKLKSLKGVREVEIEDFPIAPGKSIIKDNEILTEISIRKMREREYGFFYKLGPRQSVTISKVSVAFWADIKDSHFKDVRIAMGAVAPKVIKAPKAEGYLRGKEIRDEIIKMAAKIAASEAKPITDLRSTRLYRWNMVGALLYKGLLKLL